MRIYECDELGEEPEPMDSDGNYMPVCKSCGAKYPASHNFDCPEAQE